MFGESFQARCFHKLFAKASTAYCQVILLWILSYNASAAGLINYAPTNFTERAAQPFFYSIGRDLKHGVSINEEAATLFKSDSAAERFDWVRPSPDQMKATALVKDSLYIIRPGKPVLKVLDQVDRVFFYTGEWDPTSRYFFIPVTAPENIKGIQRGRSTSLLRIDTEGDTAIAAMIPSSEFNLISRFFVVDHNTACFNTSPNRRDVAMQCWTNGQMRAVKEIDANRIALEDGHVIDGPFLSYKPTYGGEIYLAANGFSAKMVSGSDFIQIFHASHPDRPILTIEGAIHALKGHFMDGISWNGSSVLPGGRYAFVDVLSSKKKLLADGESGLYKELPKDTRVWINFNSQSYPNTLHVINHGHSHFDVELKSEDGLFRSHVQ